jgi:hypothetical protein
MFLSILAAILLTSTEADTAQANNEEINLSGEEWLRRWNGTDASALTSTEADTAQANTEEIHLSGEEWVEELKWLWRWNGTDASALEDVFVDDDPFFGAGRPTVQNLSEFWSVSASGVSGIPDELRTAVVETEAQALAAGSVRAVFHHRGSGDRRTGFELYHITAAVAIVVPVLVLALFALVALVRMQRPSPISTPQATTAHVLSPHSILQATAASYV